MIDSEPKAMKSLMQIHHQGIMPYAWKITADSAHQKFLVGTLEKKKNLILHCFLINDIYMFMLFMFWHLVMLFFFFLLELT